MGRSVRGADLVIEALQVAETQYLFTLSGNQIMPLFDASIGSGVELIHVRHEAAAVHCADAWGRLTGQPGVAAVTAGPGFANTLSALYVARMAESPLLLLSGHTSLDQAGRGAFQEMPQAEIAAHVVKASWTAGSAAQLGHDIARALRTAISGRPGPVHLALPFDLLNAVVERSRQTVPPAESLQPMMGLLDMPAAEAILDAVAAAARPLFLAGPSVLHRGRPLLDALEQTTGIPAIGMESPRGINDPGLGAFAEMLAESDLVILIGKKLDFSLSFGAFASQGEACRFIQLDPEMPVLEQTRRVLDDPDRLLQTELVDSLPAIERLTQAAAQRQWPNAEWRQKVRDAIAFRPAEWSTLRSADAGPLHAVEVGRAVHEILDRDDDAVFISDGGEFGQWMQAAIATPHRVINGPSGAIGGGIPFALAARLAFPRSPIVATLGDGTFGFLPMEFETALRHNLPFVAVVGNDACWNAEHQIQLREYGPERLIGCDLLPTRYDEVVRAMGGHGENVTHADQLEPALNRALESQRPACVNVAVGRTAAPLIRPKSAT